MSVDGGGGGDDAGAKTGVEHSPLLFLAAFSLMAYQPPPLHSVLYLIYFVHIPVRTSFDDGAHVIDM